MTILSNEAPAKSYKFSPTCDECGERFQTNACNARFCCPQHNKDWYNRRSKRGNEVYDFLMLRRYGDEKVQGKNSRAYANECLAIVDALLAGFHESDIQLRAGRRSYNTLVDAKNALNRLPGAADNR